MRPDLFSHFVLRTPLYPFEELRVLLQKESSEEAIQYLFEWFSIPLNKEALYLASPSLHDGLVAIGSAQSDATEKQRSVALALLKYFIRMTTRPTPFGLFAGCTPGSFGETSNILLEPPQQHQRYTRLDMNFLCALSEDLSKQKVLRQHLRFFPNNSLYPTKEGWRYVDYRYEKSNKLHQLSAIGHSPYIAHVVEAAKNGNTLPELANSVVRFDPEIDVGDAVEFVQELADQQVLTSELLPALSGGDFLDQIIRTLSRFDNELMIDLNEQELSLGTFIQQLQDQQQQLRTIDRQSGSETFGYPECISQLRKWGTAFEEKMLFQTDIAKPAHQCTLDEQIQPQLADAIEVLQRFSPIRHSNTLEAFKQTFSERYGEREVPLMQALDVECGIGYRQNQQDGMDHNPLLHDLFLPGQPPKSSTIKWDARQELLHKKYLDSLAHKSHEVVITSNDLKHLGQPADVPNTFGLMASPVHLDGEALWLIQRAGDSSAANLLGRFCHLHEGIQEMAESVTQWESSKLNDDTLLAEVVHLPESRVGNVLLRPLLHSYEIPYLAQSNLPYDQQIHPNDLYLSLQDGQLVIRSKRLQKRILPRLTSAHNFHFNALPVYQFLCDLQNQHTPGNFDIAWPGVLSTQTFFPRIRYKSVILQAAAWHFTFEQYPKLEGLNDRERIEQIGTWRSKWNLPRYMALSVADNELLIDFKHPLSVEMWYHSIKQKPGFRMVEVLQWEQNSLAKDTLSHNYATQFVFGMHRSDPIAGLSTPDSSPMPAVKSPTFEIGSEWLYFKWYTGRQAADQLLTDLLLSVGQELSQQGLIDRWFFIRYVDPKHHLRVRFHLNNPENAAATGQVIKTLHRALEPWINSGIVWKVQADTYQRELQRYGGAAIVHSESLFCYESEMIAKTIALLEGDTGEMYRWWFAIRAIDQLLDDFGYSTDEKVLLTKWLADTFGEEFGKDQELRKQLAALFRKERITIGTILNRQSYEHSELQTLWGLLDHKSQASKSDCSELIDHINSGRAGLNRDQLMASFLHMLVNRIFRSQQREHELVIYDLLWSHYRSVRARNRATQSLAVPA